MIIIVRAKTAEKCDVGKISPVMQLPGGNLLHGSFQGCFFLYGWY